MGLAKVVFGLLVGAIGIFLGSRALGRMVRWGEPDAEQKKGNVAVAILKASGLLALGILVQHAVGATFDAMDLLYRGHELGAGMFGRFAFYGLLHVGFSMVVGACVLATGAWLFGRLTRGVDEMAEVRAGNVAPALVLGAVMVVMALVTAPGLKTALDGLLPLPTLGRDEMVAPS
jgi:uncharacterized membrane protein YjfL (UPF0719 family)